MARATLAKLNAHIEARLPGVSIWNPGGYFAFGYADDYTGPEIASIYVCYLNQLTLEQWIARIDEQINEAQEKNPL